MAPAPQINTVSGPLDATALGKTLGHEHLRFRDDAVAANWPSRYDPAAELRAAVDAVGVAMAHGVRTIVDPTAMNAGRDVRFLARVAELTGVQIVACTGIYTFDRLPFYFENRSVDVMADHFAEDVEQGIQGTDVRAAFIKVAADEPGITPGVEKVHRAAARAALRTGVPIMAHSAPAVDNGPRQVQLLLEEGVDPAHVQICHYGDTTDVDQIERLLELGVYVGLDRFGSPRPPFTAARIDVAAELLRRGRGDRLVVSHDFCATIDWFPPETMEAIVREGESNPYGMGLVFERVVPALLEAGALDDAALQRLFADNPRNWLTGAQRT
ncbi:phosphotriesterase [Conexibacter sp. CPCC 206217]|uniref:phosphotriesterase family protein n=1 Tax=Conexibacter sp. CPCC 206217 TaxID=3064574 RepID=UPI00271ED328|nr:hypothetical protein [Conexibacter sp. CPCC 206217]MDO8213146.1 hypothetical protein [Conexibacter sp. CPCC 206217]